MQDINRQVRELKQQGATDNSIYLEHESGAKENRAELQKLLNALQPQDTIIATEVSRITRNTYKGSFQRKTFPDYVSCLIRPFSNTSV